MTIGWIKSATLGGIVSVCAALPASGQVMAPDLKAAPPATLVTAIQYCKARGEFRLTFGDGKARTWAEFSVALKVDSTDKGPPPGKAVTLPSGKAGDRILLIFASLEDLTRMPQAGC